MFGESGLRDWKIQRVSAAFLVFALLSLVSFFIVNGIEYTLWRDLMSQLWVKLVSVGVVFSLLAHAWVGVWTIATDYIKCNAVRLCILSLFAAALVGYGAWAIQIVWSV